MALGHCPKAAPKARTPMRSSAQLQRLALACCWAARSWSRSRPSPVGGGRSSSVWRHSRSHRPWCWLWCRPQQRQHRRWLRPLRRCKPRHPLPSLPPWCLQNQQPRRSHRPPSAERQRPSRRHAQHPGLREVRQGPLQLGRLRHQRCRRRRRPLLLRQLAQQHGLPWSALPICPPTCARSGRASHPLAASTATTPANACSCSATKCCKKAKPPTPKRASSQ